MNEFENQHQHKPPAQANLAISWLKGIGGAVVGGIVGYLLFSLLLRNGLYAGIVPGAFVGIGFSIASRRGNVLAGVICGIAGLIFGCWCDAVTNDPPESLIQYFETIGQVPGINIIMIIVGGLAAFWFAQGHRG